MESPGVGKSLQIDEKGMMRQAFLNLLILLWYIQWIVKSVKNRKFVYMKKYIFVKLHEIIRIGVYSFIHAISAYV